MRATTPAAGSGVPRVRPAGVLMAGIMAATILGLVYLTQTLGANATTSRISHLGEAREALLTEITVQQEWALRRTDAEVLLPRIKGRNLQRLGDAVVLRAP